MPNELLNIKEERRAPERRVLPDRRMTSSAIGASVLKRLSWQGLVVGALLALALQVAFFVLGMAVGIYTPPDSGSFTARIGLWEIVMTVVSLAAAGAVGARVAGIPSRRDSAMHGVVIWALDILIAPSLGGRIGVASAFAIPTDLHAAFWAFSALVAGLLAASLSAWCAAPHVDVYVRRRTEISAV